MTSAVTNRLPDWFVRALQHPCRDSHIQSNGIPIHYREWSAGEELPGLILIHGHAANAHWWDFIAPALTDRFRVIALDLSGAGDSGHRRSYSNELFVQEVMDVKHHAGLDDRTVLVGHSFGGRVARHTVSGNVRDFHGIVLVDSSMAPARRAPERMTRTKPVRYYASCEQAVRRFRLRPWQPCSNDYLLLHIARHSVAQDRDRWYWKLDPTVFARMPDLGDDPDPVRMLASLPCRKGIIYGRQSRFFPAQIVDSLARSMPALDVVGIEHAQHHLVLDQPQSFIAELRAMLDRWRTDPSPQRPVQEPSR